MDKTKDNETARNFLAILGAPVLLMLIFIAVLPIGIFNAWVAQKLYIWFVIPMGAPAINLWHVYGLILLINLLKSSSSSEDKSTAKHLGSILGTVVGALLILLIAFIVKGHI